MEYCQDIKDTQMLDMLAIHYPQNNEERYFLFPGLITEKVEDLPNVKCIEDLWQPILTSLTALTIASGLLSAMERDSTSVLVSTRSFF